MFTVVIYCLWAVFGHFKLNIYSNFFRSLATTTEKMGNMRTGDEIVNPCIAKLRISLIMIMELPLVYHETEIYQHFILRFSNKQKKYTKPRHDFFHKRGNGTRREQ